MIAFLVFPLLIASVVWFAGHRDSSRDPRLTTLSLALLALFPLLLLLPKIPLLPEEPSPTDAVANSTFSFWIFTAIWFTGFAIQAIKLALSGLGLARWRRQSVSIGKTDEGVELRRLDGIHGPVAAGVFRKVIFVPSAWSDWNASTRETILLHELAHHRRRDPLVRWIAALAAAVHWFNPLVHWMNRRLALQCEQACDQRVISAGVNPRQYAELLCRFATQRSQPIAGLAMAEMSSLESRIRRLMRPSSQRGFFTLALLSSFTLAAAVVFSLIGHRATPGTAPQPAEVELRLTANPFPADSP